VLLVAVSTVDWSARRWHKRYFRLCAAVGAFDFRHLPRGTTSILITHFRIPPSLFSSYTKIILDAIIGTSQATLPVIHAGKIFSILTTQYAGLV